MWPCICSFISSWAQKLSPVSSCTVAVAVEFSHRLIDAKRSPAKTVAPSKSPSQVTASKSTFTPLSAMPFVLAMFWPEDIANLKGAKSLVWRRSGWLSHVATCGLCNGTVCGWLLHLFLLHFNGYVCEYLTSKPLLRYGLSQFSSEYAASWGGHK